MESNYIMDINKFEGQGFLVTYEGDRIPIELIRQDDKINIIIDRYLLKKATNASFLSNYNYVIQGQKEPENKIRTYAWKAGIDGYKLKVHPKNDLIQLCGILTDILLVTQMNPIVPGQSQKLIVDDNLSYTLHFDEQGELLKLERQDDPGYGVRSALVVQFETVRPLSELPYKEGCDNYEISLDYYGEHVKSWIDALNEPKEKRACYNFDCGMKNCEDSYNCPGSGCTDSPKPYKIQNYPLIEGMVDFRDMATVPEPRVAFVKVDLPKVQRIVQPQQPEITHVVHATPPKVSQLVVQQPPKVHKIINVQNVLERRPARVHNIVEKQPPHVHSYARYKPPKVTEIVTPAKFNLTDLVEHPKNPYHGPYMTHSHPDHYNHKHYHGIHEDHTFPLERSRVVNVDQPQPSIVRAVETTQPDVITHHDPYYVPMRMSNTQMVFPNQMMNASHKVVYGDNTMIHDAQRHGIHNVYGDNTIFHGAQGDTIHDPHASHQGDKTHHEYHMHGVPHTHHSADIHNADHALHNEYHMHNIPHIHVAPVPNVPLPKPKLKPRTLGRLIRSHRPGADVRAEAPDPTKKPEGFQSIEPFENDMEDDVEVDMELDMENDMENDMELDMPLNMEQDEPKKKSNKGISIASLILCISLLLMVGIGLIVYLMNKRNPAIKTISEYSATSP